MPDQPQPQSFLSWQLEVLGPIYAGLIPLTALLVLGGGCCIAVRCRRPGPIAACLALALLPILIGACGMLEGLFALCEHLSLRPQHPPKAYGPSIALAILAPLTAVMVSLPSFLILPAAVLWRVVETERGSASSGRAVETQ